MAPARSAADETSPARRGPWVLLSCLATAGVLSWLLADNRNDDAYITYRHAQNLIAGHGLVFNPGERLLVTTAPFHALLLGVVGALGVPLVPLALFVSAVATGALAYFIYRLLVAAGDPVAGMIGAATVLSLRLTYEVAPLETVLMTATCWGALLALERSASRTAGVAAGLALGLRGDTAIWIGLAWISRALRSRDAVSLARSAAAAMAVIGPWLAFAWWYYGTPLPVTAGAKTGWDGHAWMFADRLWERGVGQLLVGVPAAALGLVLSILGAVRIWRRPGFGALRMVPIWVVTYIAAYTALRIFWAHHWYYYPLVVGVALCFAVGAAESGRFVTGRLRIAARRPARVGLALVLGAALAANLAEIAAFRDRIPQDFFVGGRDELYRMAAAWIRKNTSEGASVACTEPGTLAFHSNRRMVDMMGLATPTAGEEMKRTGQRSVSPQWTAEHFNPTIFVLSWPTQQPFPDALPGASAYRVRHALAVPGVDTGLIVYGRSPP